MNVILQSSINSIDLLKPYSPINSLKSLLIACLRLLISLVEWYVYGVFIYPNKL